LRTIIQALVSIVLIGWGAMWVIGASKMFWDGTDVDAKRLGILILFCGAASVVLGIWVARKRSL
jgi:hypothetical protein